MPGNRAAPLSYDVCHVDRKLCVLAFRPSLPLSKSLFTGLELRYPDRQPTAIAETPYPTKEKKSGTNGTATESPCRYRNRINLRP